VISLARVARCARDVCNILEYSDYRRSIFDYVDEEDKKSLYDILRVVGKTPTTLNNETKACFSESGLYDLISHSRMPNAKNFRNGSQRSSTWIKKKRPIHDNRKSEWNNILRKQFEEQLHIKDQQINQKNQQIEEQKQRIEHDQNHILLTRMCSWLLILDK
jgi:hypothetical protein